MSEVKAVSLKELQELWVKRPMLYSETKQSDLAEWRLNFEAKFEAFVEQHEKRMALLRDHRNDFPEMHDKRLRKYSYALPRFTQWLKDILEWKKRLDARLGEAPQKEVK